MSQRAWERQVKAFGRGPINNKEIPMDKPPMMECGHAANATNAKTGKPSCVICIGIHSGAEKIAEQGPDLTGRMAHCAYGCGNEKPSSTSLPFFEYLGPESSQAREVCKCGYRRIAHGKADVARRRQGICNNFQPKGDVGHDRYYCGCRGWD